VALAEQLTLARAALEDTPHAAPTLVRLQSVSEIPVGFEFVRGHGRQGAVPTTPPRRKVMRGGKDRCGTERGWPWAWPPRVTEPLGASRRPCRQCVQSTAEGCGESRCSKSP